MYFEYKIKYYKQEGTGEQKKVSEHYILESETWTEAEQEISSIMENEGVSEYSISDIKKSKITEIFEDSGELFVKASVDFLTLDENSGKETKQRYYYLIRAEDLAGGLSKLEEKLSDSVVSFLINKIEISSILEAYKREKSEAVEFLETIILETSKNLNKINNS